MVIDPGIHPFFVENVHDFVWALDPVSRQFTYVNKAVTLFLGYTPEELTARELGWVFAAVERGRLDTALVASVGAHFLSGRARSDCAWVVEHRHKDGRAVWAEVRLTVLGTKREELRLLGLTRKATGNRGQYERDNRSRALLEAAPLGAVISARQRVVWANQRAVRLLGAGHLGQLVGRETISLVHPDDHPRALRRHRMAEHEGIKPPDEKVLCQRLDGTAIPFEVSSSGVVFDEEPARVIFLREEVPPTPVPAARPERADRCWGLVAFLPEAVIVQQEGRGVVYLNGAARRLLRIDAHEELRGAELEQFVDPECWPHLARRLADRAGAVASRFSADCVLRARDGSEVPVELTGERMELEGVNSMVVFARDLSRLRATAARLAERESLLGSIYRIAPVGVGVMHNRVIVEANPRLCQLLGHELGALDRRPSRELYDSAEEFERVGTEIRRQIDAQGFARLTTRWRRKDGRAVETELHLAALTTGRTGEWLLCVAEDVSGWAETQRAIAANEAELRAVYEGAPIMLLLLDEAGLCCRLNGATRTFIGASAAEALGQRVDRLLQCPRDAGRRADQAAGGCGWRVWRRTLRQAAAGIATQRQELTLELMRAGAPCECVLLVSATPLPRENGVKTLLWLEDITEHKRLAAQLRQAQKLDEIGRLAAGLAHDFNNLFLSLTVHLGMLQNAAGVGRELAQKIADLEAEARLGNQLSQKLLGLGRRQALSPTRIDVGQIVAQTLRGLRHVLEPKIRVVVVPPPQPLHLLGEPGMLEQILLNLCLNARDAMPEGGVLNLRIQSVMFPRRRRDRPPFARAGPFVVLSVGDTGCGMDARVMQRLFEPFFTTKDPARGTGLGLVTMRAIVQRHDGWIEVQSQPGGGAVFEIGLPAAR